MAEVLFPKSYQGLFKPARYKIYYGGRGSAKSWNYARALLTIAHSRPIRVLCGRELQSSIKDSVHRLLCDQIERMELQAHFSTINNEIRGINGSLFIFEGLRHNINNIKSKEGIDIAWIEEAEKVSEESWQVLIPTIRKEHSEIWISFNPALEHDPTYQRFVIKTPPDSIIQKVSWRDNPWFPDALAKERDYLARVDPDAYAHVWEGETITKSEAQVLNGKWIIDMFDEADLGTPYFGADWGFATDPSVLIKFYLKDKVMYVRNEAYGLGVETVDLPEMFSKVLDSSRYVIRGDNARPEIISHLKRHGFPKMESAKKWAGSVEDGISWIRGLEKIIIHPECKHTIDEARLWSYKRDRLTGDVLPVLIDAHNHCWDAIRYGAQPMIKPANNLIMEWA
jgi:phage terminase large subunit